MKEQSLNLKLTHTDEMTHESLSVGAAPPLFPSCCSSPPFLPISTLVNSRGAEGASNSKGGHNSKNTCNIIQSSKTADNNKIIVKLSQQ